MPREERIPNDWRNETLIHTTPYQCGYCNTVVAPDKGWSIDGSGAGPPLIQICPYCHKPTLWDRDHARYPSPRFGEQVTHVPADLIQLYNEARDSISVAAYTGVVLVCRTIISHIAVQKGAGANLSFKQYVEFLRDNHHIPQGSDVWVDAIRDVGNFATHELKVVTKQMAEVILKFVEMLLKITFEYPKAAKQLSPTP